MAIIDDLVASGLSVTQAQEVIDSNVGASSEAEMVAQGFSGVQASTVIGGSPTAADLANAGFSTPQELGILAALAANNAPVANAGPAQTVEIDDLVTLDGSGSYDPNGDSVTYAWTLTSKPEGSTATLTGATTVAPTFTADLAGAYVASLVVSDGVVNSSPSTVTITAEE